MTTKTKRPGAERAPTPEQKRVLTLVQRFVKTMTLEEIAAAIDVSLASVSRWARGTTMPYRNTARNLLPKLEALAK